MAAQRAVLITGATRGIGAAAALAFAARGFRVLGTTRGSEGLDALRKAGCEPLRLDLADAASVARAAEEVLARGGVDVLVNNAGIVELGPVAGFEREAWERLLAVNVVGTFDLTRRLLPAMRDRGGGRVLFLSSVLGRMSVPYAGPYAASKHALEAAADALRVEARPFGVRVTLVEPGPVRTEFTKDAVPGLVRRARAAGYEEAADRAERFAWRFTRGSAPEQVARVLVREATRARPRARVPVGPVPRLLLPLAKLAPTALRDEVLARFLRLAWRR